jgi:4-hydroxyphenylpyruvate dioxygenase
VHVSDYASALTVIDIVNHDNLGLTLDSFHWFAKDQPLSLLAAIPAGKIAHVQLADGYRGATVDFLRYSRFHRLPLGEGSLPNFDFLRILKRAGYRGALSLEIFNPDRFRLSDRALALWYHETLAMTLRPIEEPVPARHGHRAEIEAAPFIPAARESLHGH